MALPALSAGYVGEQMLYFRQCYLSHSLWLHGQWQWTFINQVQPPCDLWQDDVYLLFPFSCSIHFMSKISVCHTKRIYLNRFCCYCKHRTFIRFWAVPPVPSTPPLIQNVSLISRPGHFRKESVLAGMFLITLSLFSGGNLDIICIARGNKVLLTLASGVQTISVDFFMRLKSLPLMLRQQSTVSSSPGRWDPREETWGNSGCW